MLTRSQHAASTKVTTRSEPARTKWITIKQCTKTRCRCYFWYDHTFRSTARPTRPPTNKRQSRQRTAPPRGEIVERHSHPALVASRLRESSLSPCERTCPQSANEVYEFDARPLASTSTTLIWTDAWSLEVIRRSATHAHWIVSVVSGETLTSGRTLAGDVEINENTLHRARKSFKATGPIAESAYLVVFHCKIVKLRWMSNAEMGTMDVWEYIRSELYRS